MAISVECPSCQSAFQVSEERGGSMETCPACSAEVAVPSTVRAGGAAKKAKAARVREGALPGVGVSAEGVRHAAAPTRRERTPDEILAAFRGAIAPFRPSPLYRLWLVIGAGVMVLLPLIYVALIALVIVAMAYHAVHDVAIFQHFRGGSIKGAVLIYVAPLISGAIMVAFMVKPFFARQAKGNEGRILDPQDEPLLFAFVDGICSSVGAPRPRRIKVDCDNNAAAGYAGGPFSWRARAPYLVIGLVLVAGLDLKQLAGVMAHELGHIAQRSGMWLTAVISSINNWFARVVYERDSWDESLEAWSKDSNRQLAALGHVARLAVWLTRRILWVLLHVGHLVNMVVFRQQEYDADRYEARMVGGKTFARTAWRLAELQLASRLAMADLQSSWQQRRLPDNYPKLVLANVPQIPQATVDAYRQSWDQDRTGLFDTHPSQRDRIAHAQAEEPGAGIFDLVGPATDVFRDFDAIARSVSFDYYQSMLGQDLRQEQLYPVAELVETQAAGQEGRLAFDRFFMIGLSLTQHFALPAAYPEASATPDSTRPALVQARADQLAARGESLAASNRDEELYRRIVTATTAWFMRRFDIPLDAEAWELPAATVEAAESVRDEAVSEFAGLSARFEPYAVAAARRLTLSLALLEQDTLTDQLEDGGQRREEAHTLYPCAMHLGGNVVSQLDPALRAKKVLAMLVELRNEIKDKEYQPVIDAIHHAAADLRAKLEVLRSTVGDAVDYPFEHAHTDITVGQFVFPAQWPANDDVDGLLEVAGAAIDRLLGLYKQALGRLAVTAEEVERALGLEPVVWDDAV
jgi:Zn-dependent protease with chaperone function